MEKSFRGITKEDFRGLILEDGKLCILYIERYDNNDGHEKSFRCETAVEDTEENRRKIADIFNATVNFEEDIRKPKSVVIAHSADVVTNIWYSCPHCGYTQNYEIEGAKKQEDIDYIITTECCLKRIQLKGIEEV